MENYVWPSIKPYWLWQINNINTVFVLIKVLIKQQQDTYHLIMKWYVRHLNINWPSIVYHETKKWNETIKLPLYLDRSLELYTDERIHTRITVKTFSGPLLYTYTFFISTDCVLIFTVYHDCFDLSLLVIQLMEVFCFFFFLFLLIRYSVAIYR